MSLEKLFQSAVRELRKRDVLFAVAGGFAADLYRHEPRLTMDVDLVILTKSSGTQTATSVIRSLGLRAGIAREADLAGGPLFAIRRRSTKPCIVVGRPAGDPAGEGVDILLPAIPWVADAVRRAQANLVDFGFGPVPALTLEDAVLAKLCALNSGRLRAKHLDDLQSIFDAGHDVDVSYLAGQMRRFGITIPRQAEPFLPDIVLKISRDIVRSARTSRGKRA
jgi:hypothetical protein